MAKAHFRLSISTLLCCLVLTPCAGGGPSSDPLVSRFLSEAPKAWDAYSEFAGHLQGISTATQVGPLNRIKKWNFEIKQDGCNSLGFFQYLGPKENKGKVTCKNSRYAFILERQDRSSSWVLTKLDLGVHEGVSDLLKLKCHPYIDDTMPQLHLYSNKSLSHYLADPSFNLIRALPVNIGGTELVRIEFDYHPKPGPPFEALRGGWALLDPHNHWFIKESEVSGEWPDGKGKVKMKNEYKKHNENYSIIVKVQEYWEGTMLNGKEVSHTTNYDINYYYMKIPESEFTLTAFGLPEPEGEESSHLYLYLSLAGFICLGLALLFRWRGRRHSAA